MPRISIRRLIGVIAVMVAVATAIAIPAGYALTSYVAEADALAFKARLNANRVAKYVYAHGELWSYQHARLAELIEIAGSVDPELVRQRIYAHPDRLVLEEDRALAWPTFVRSAPIVVGSAEVGRIEAETSLRPLIVRSATVAAVAIMFAVASFLILYRVPRRILDRTLGMLAAREQDLATQVYRFEFALEHMSQGLSMFDGDERLLVCNAKYLAIYRLSGDEVKPGIRFSEILACRARSGTDPRAGDELILTWRANLRARQAIDGEMVLSDGRTIAVSTRHTVGGGWISLHYDITDILNAETDRLRAESENEQLRQQERVAEMANRAKSAFVAMMSHEIRTPMNAVIGLTSTLLETAVDAEQRCMLAAVHESSESLLRILNDVLDYSKLDAGKLEFEQRAFSPVALVDHMVSLTSAPAKSKGLTVRVEQDPALPPALVGDAGRLRQVLMNLLSNAVKFTWEGGITLSTRCLARARDRVQVEWTVTDTGIGIPPDRIDSLFSEFVQADSSISRRYGGSGLGLAISKRIIEQMGGRITVSSAPGAGSTFRVVLWLRGAAATAIEEQHDDGDVVAALKARIAAIGRPLRILIAEDNPTNQLVTVKMLKDFDIVTQIAVNGLEAVAAAESAAFDVILMDMRMPEMDGLAATEAIRQRGGALAEVPIIALTANAFAQDVKACHDAGMTDFVAKPVRKHAIIETILHALPAGPVLRRTGRPVDAAGPAALPAAPATPVAGTGGQENLVVDLAAFDELAHEIGPDGVRQILTIFLRETGRRLGDMRRMSCGADRDAIKNEAHTLKGAAGTFGMRELSALARTLEAGVGEITEDGYRRALERLDAAFALARARIPAEFRDAA